MTLLGRSGLSKKLVKSKRLRNCITQSLRRAVFLTHVFGSPSLTVIFASVDPVILKENKLATNEEKKIASTELMLASEKYVH